jgi:hypothetical protein
MFVVMADGDVFLFVDGPCANGKAAPHCDGRTDNTTRLPCNVPCFFLVSLLHNRRLFSNLALST